MIINDDLEKLILKFPFVIYYYLITHSYKTQLIEIVLDLGRRPEARFQKGSEYLSKKLVSWQDIEYLTKRVSKFSWENRAGIERTLHRISCIRNRQFLINGLTCRVGRVIFGTISIIRDLLQLERSILVLGKPGVGKTTIIREIARILADEMEKRVIIVDTSNEIAGESDIPHSGIGCARRMQVMKAELQHRIMIEAVENHMPEVIIIDEIGTELEVLAVRTISEKGVQLVGTTHGSCLKDLIRNPLLSNLIGGVEHVTLSDDEAKRRGTQKTILERKIDPTFQLAIEINSQDFWTIHENVKNSIDFFLRNYSNIMQIRRVWPFKKSEIKIKDFNSKSKLQLKQQFHSKIQNWNLTKKIKSNQLSKLKSQTFIIYSYSLSTNLIREIILKIGFKFTLTNEIRKASLIIGLKKHLNQNYKLKNLVKFTQVPVYGLNSINVYKLIKVLYFTIYKSKGKT